MDEEQYEVEPYVIVNNLPCACGSDAIMHDLYGDEEIHWCSHCGRPVIYQDEEPEYEDQENEQSESLS